MASTNKATLRKAAEQPEVHVDLDAGERPSLETAREALFKLGGVVYTIPMVCPPGVSLEYLRLAGIAGEQTALIFAMQRLIDQNGYAKLVADPTLTAAELGQIMAVVIAKVTDGFRLPKA